MAFLVWLHLQANKSRLAPIAAPRILDQPVARTAAPLVPHERHHVIQGKFAGAALACSVTRPVAVDPTGVKSPAPGIDAHGDGPSCHSQRLLQIAELVALKHHVPADPKLLRGEQRRLARLHIPVVGRVCPLRCEREPPLLHQLEGQFTGGSFATPEAAAVSRVRCARQDRLGRKGGVPVGLGRCTRLAHGHHQGWLPGHVPFQHRNGSHGPTGAATALVPDDLPKGGAVGREAEGARDGDPCLALERHGYLGERRLRMRPLVAQRCPELLVVVVHEAGDALCPRKRRAGTEVDDLPKPLVEDALAPGPLLRARHVLPLKLLYKGRERVTPQLLQVGIL
mmetsp:Transcript_89450/g.289547  ORF Transcript_89450/g.289547 Transcript_89450/m.289547 type:complete len:339 (-) Transcript_89450:129-1145(-)